MKKARVGLTKTRNDDDRLVVIAMIVRQILVQRHGKNNLSLQCRWAAVTIDRLFKKLGMTGGSLRSGWISKAGDRAHGHIWNRIKTDNGVRLLDATLTQFHPQAPANIYGPYQETARMYDYIEDGLGPYRYDVYEVDDTLVDEALALLSDSV